MNASTVIKRLCLCLAAGIVCALLYDRHPVAAATVLLVAVWVRLCVWLTEP